MRLWSKHTILPLAGKYGTTDLVFPGRKELDSPQSNEFSYIERDFDKGS